MIIKLIKFIALYLRILSYKSRDMTSSTRLEVAILDLLGREFLGRRLLFMNFVFYVG